MQIQQSIRALKHTYEPTTPRLYGPSRSCISPHADQVEAGNLDWLNRQSVSPTLSAAVRASRGRFGRLAARAYPDASLEGLRIAADWLTWLFLHDDLLDKGVIASDARAMRVLVDDQISALSDPRSPRSVDPLTNALADLCKRMMAMSSPRWMTRFRSHVLDYFEASLWKAENSTYGRVPDLRTYLRLRDLTGPVRTCFDIHELIHGTVLPVAARCHPTILRMLQLTNRAICWSNDLSSIGQPRATGDAHNIVTVLQHDAGLQLDDAIAEAARMHDDAVHSLESYEQRLIESEISPDVEPLVASLKRWIQANLDWSAETGWYQLLP
jgi:hypothetical protein